jgi:predicted ester cyclase
MPSRLIALLLSVLLAGCATRPAAAPATPNAVANRELVLAFHAALNRSDFAAAERLLDPGYRHHAVSAEGFKTLTWEQFKRGNTAVRTAFPDWTNTPLHVVAEGDHVSVLLLGTGTHRGSLAGEPVSGRKVTLPIALTHEVRNGRLVADWEVVDTGPLMRSLAGPTH